MSKLFKSSIKTCFLILMVMVNLTIAANIWAHGTESHAKDNAVTDEDLSVKDKPIIPLEYFGDLVDDLSYAEFPTLHPLIVHVPVVLIPLSWLFLIVGIFLRNPSFFRISVIILSVGVLGALMATFVFHPHTVNLSQDAEIALNKHDFFAYATLSLGAMSIFVGVISCYKPFNPIKWIYIMMLFLATCSVVITGHYGGKLAYTHGIGVQGKYLDNENMERNHE